MRKKINREKMKQSKKINRESLKTIIKKLRKIDGRNNYLLKGFVIIFILGYVFFFTSNYFFPKIYKNTDNIIHAGDVIDMEEYIFTLSTWDYSKDDNMFEIIMDVKNLTLERKPKFSFVVKSGEKIFTTTVHKNYDNKLIVLRVNGIPKRWAEVKLSITAGDKNIQATMNDKIVHRVKSIKNKNRNETEVYSIERKLAGLKESIKRKNKEIKKIASDMEYAYSKMEEIEKEKDYKTAKEKEIAEKNKANIATAIGKSKAEMDKRNVEIEEMKGQIDFFKEKLKLLKH